MPSITFDKFNVGLDRRKGASVSDANRLRELKNAYVTTGSAIRKRPGLSLVTSLDTGTAGLFGWRRRWWWRRNTWIGWKWWRRNCDYSLDVT